MTNFFTYAKAAADTSSDYSPNIWKSCPVEALKAGLGGVLFEDDFLDVNLPGTQTSEVAFGRYKAYNTGSGTVKTNASLDGTMTQGGIISMLCDTAGDASVFGMQATPFVLSGLTTNSGKMWFEARIAVTGIATNNIQMFLGLGQNDVFTFGAAKPLADANGVATDGPFFGFQMTEDGVGVVNASYADEAATWTNALAGLGTLAASTWAKPGFIYDPTDPINTIRFFWNGVQSSTVMSKATLTALTHLDASPLGLLFATFADSAGTSTYAYMDKWRCAQLSVDG
jgi:hypothetical protein